MELITTLLQYLSNTFTPLEFIVVICVILMCTYMTVKYILRSAKKEDGMWAFLDTSEESELELADIQDDIYKSSRESKKQFDEIEKTTKQILDILIKMQEQDKETAESLLNHIEELNRLDAFLKETKLHIEKQFDDMKHQYKMHDIHDHQAFETLKSALEDAMEIMERVNSQVEKIGDYVKNVVPEFKASHRDISKDISDLSRDIALIERSLQNQINTSQRGINLR